MTQSPSPVTQSFAADVAAIAAIDAVPRILDVVCRTTGMGFAAVTRVTHDRWIACAVSDDIAFGLQPGGELDLKTTLCDEVRASRRLVVIDHVAQDAHYCRHRTPELYGFQSYISAPIFLTRGEFFGTLCAIDPRPASLNNPATLNMFTLFADLIGFHLDARDHLDASRRELAEERRGGHLRDQFIAVLGHDLRNPLAAIQTAGTLLGMMPLDERARRAASIVQSSAARMAGLIDNVLDFARGQLGEGVPVAIEEVADLEATLDQVIAELRTAHTDRDVRVDLALPHPVWCDRARVAQLFSNLLGNALTHGDPSFPVRVDAQSGQEGFALAVINHGDPIPPSTLERLFQPFERGSDGPGQQGLGLGLYIASEIARAHGGRLDVRSTPEETRFTLRLPPEPPTP
jgi:signal transduction histidine kinase